MANKETVLNRSGSAVRGSATSRLNEGGSGDSVRVGRGSLMGSDRFEAKIRGLSEDVDDITMIGRRIFPSEINAVAAAKHDYLSLTTSLLMLEMVNQLLARLISTARNNAEQLLEYERQVNAGRHGG